MRSFLAVLTLSFSVQTYAIELHSLNFDITSNQLIADVTYNGGCAESELELRVLYYRKSNPPQIGAEIVSPQKADCTAQLRAKKSVKFPSYLKSGERIDVFDDQSKRHLKSALSICLPECRKDGLSKLYLDPKSIGQFKKLKKPRNGSK